MYKLLLATDRPEILAAFQAVPSWESIGFRQPRIVGSAQEAIESLGRNHADAIAFALSDEDEQMLTSTLLEKYPLLPICAASGDSKVVAAYAKELSSLLTRTHMDYSDDDTSEADMMQLCRHEFFRALIGGRVKSRANTLRYLKLLRSRMDPAKAAVLVEMTLPADDEFLTNRWHDGVDRLEVALRNFFGAELEGMRILVSVLPDDRICLLCCTMLGEKGPEAGEYMTHLIQTHAQDSIEHVREYLNLDLRLGAIRVMSTLAELADE